MWAGEGSADEIIEKKGLKQITDTGAIGEVGTKCSPRTEVGRGVPRRKGKAFNASWPGDEGRARGQANPAA